MSSISGIRGSDPWFREIETPQNEGKTAPALNQPAANGSKQEDSSVLNRVLGGVQALWGAGQAFGGAVFGVATSETVVAALAGGAVAAHGVDDFQAGVRQMWTGKPVENVTQTLATAAATKMGASPGAAAAVGVVVDMAAGGPSGGLKKAGEKAVVKASEEFEKAATAGANAEKTSEELAQKTPAGADKSAEAAATERKVDVSGNYTFREYKDGPYTYKEAKGQLGMPGEVVEHRSQGAQRAVSKGTGDDAGHLIDNRFGAPGGGENLSPQNWKANRHGTYKDLGDKWAAKRKRGIEIDVQVTDVTRAGEDRPFLREVQWTETAPDGSATTYKLDFANTQTEKSRLMRGVPETANGGESTLIPVDFEKRQRIR